MNPAMVTTEQRYAVDWIPVFIRVVMYLNTWPWHAKNGVTTPASQPANLTLLVWVMPLCKTYPAAVAGE